MQIGIRSTSLVYEHISQKSEKEDNDRERNTEEKVFHKFKNNFMYLRISLSYSGFEYS